VDVTHTSSTGYVDNHDGTFTNTTTTTTATLSTEKNHEGEFKSATTQTTQKTLAAGQYLYEQGKVSSTNPQSIGYRQAATLMGAGMGKGIEAAQPSYMSHLFSAIGSDMKAHPFYYGGASRPCSAIR
jgi:hypothetical protein